MLRSWLQALWRQRAVVLAAVAVQATLGVIGARVYLARHHTLQANGRWRTTKTELARGLNGSFAFLTGVQGLAGGRLNLGAWHGFHEVIYRDELSDPRRYEFDFKLGARASLVFLFDRDEQGNGAGVRLSTQRLFRNAFLRIAADGDFLERQPLKTSQLAKHLNHRADVRIEADQATLRVDGQMLGAFPLQARPRSRFGFRGRGDSWIDDITVTLADGRRVREDFDAPAGARVLTAATVLLVIAFNLGLYLALFLASRRRHAAGDSDEKAERTLAFTFLMVNLTLLVVCAMLYGFVLLRSDWYPRLDAVLRQREVYFAKGATSIVLDEIHEAHAPGPTPGRLRVLFTGSSQTWGAGALRDDQRWVSVLETLLNRRPPPAPRVECINAGVSATTARDLEPLLVHEWLPLRPDLVVINLSSNDRASGDAFLPIMRRMVVAVQEAGACPVLIKEANAAGLIEPGLRNRHHDLDVLGAELGVPVIDMHDRLGKYEDRGFLWWDRVHLTPFGQRMMAEELVEALGGVLEEAGSTPAR